MLTGGLKRRSEIKADLARLVGTRFRTRVEGRATFPSEPEEVLIRLEAGCHGPFDGEGIINVNIFIDDEDVFAGAMPTGSGFDADAASGSTSTLSFAAIAA